MNYYNATTMKKLVLICLTVLFCTCVYSQNCVMNEDAKRYYNRGVMATQIAKSTNDYKNALAEYQKAVELCSNCSELYYRMGLCCEIIGEDDNSYYTSALRYFQKSLTADNNISQELKDLIQGKIHEMEYAVEQSIIANKDALIPENLCGKWTYHAYDGDTEKLFDIVISENNGFFTVEFSSLFQHNINKDGTLSMDDPSFTLEKTADISFNDDTICFSTIHNKVHFSERDKCQWYHFKVEFNYELVLENGRLKGGSKCTRRFEAMGHTDYRYVADAVKAGRGNVSSNCTGNCGTYKVYFTK